MEFDPEEVLAKARQTPAKASEADEEQSKRERLSQAVAALRGSIAVIKEGIETGNLSAAAEAWFELTDAERDSIWIAPSRIVKEPGEKKGRKVLNEHAPFTTHEREVIHSAEFRKAYFGENV